MKELVAKEIARRVSAGSVIGVGTGTTVDAALQAIEERVKRESLHFSVVTTSYQSSWKCRQMGLNVLDGIGFDAELDWGFDGADQVDDRLRAIKGKGAAMLREKIMAARCRQYVLIADESKLCAALGRGCPVPVEVIPEALSVVRRALEKLGASKAVLRQAVAKHGPVITEAGNVILDCEFLQVGDDLEREIKTIVGVVESGLFLSYADEVLIAGKDGLKRLVVS